MSGTDTDRPTILIDGVQVEMPGGAWNPPPVAAPRVPAEVTNWQARAVLRRTFLPDRPDTSLFTRTDRLLRQARDDAAGLPESNPRRIEADLNWQAWEQANTFSRDGALLASIGALFGLTDAQVDDLFRAAAAEVI